MLSALKAALHLPPPCPSSVRTGMPGGRCAVAVPASQHFPFKEPVEHVHVHRVLQDSTTHRSVAGSAMTASGAADTSPCTRRSQKRSRSGTRVSQRKPSAPVCTSEGNACPVQSSKPAADAADERGQQACAATSPCLSDSAQSPAVPRLLSRGCPATQKMLQSVRLDPQCPAGTSQHSSMQTAYKQWLTYTPRCKQVPFATYGFGATLRLDALCILRDHLACSHDVARLHCVQAPTCTCAGGAACTNASLQSPQLPACEGQLKAEQPRAQAQSSPPRRRSRRLRAVRGQEDAPAAPSASLATVPREQRVHVLHSAAARAMHSDSKTPKRFAGRCASMSALVAAVRAFSGSTLSACSTADALHTDNADAMRSVAGRRFPDSVSSLTLECWGMCASVQGVLDCAVEGLSASPPAAAQLYDFQASWGVAVPMACSVGWRVFQCMPLQFVAPPQSGTPWPFAHSTATHGQALLHFEVMHIMLLAEEALLCPSTHARCPPSMQVCVAHVAAQAWLTAAAATHGMLWAVCVPCATVLRTVVRLHHAEKEAEEHIMTRVHSLLQAVLQFCKEEADGFQDAASVQA